MGGDEKESNLYIQHFGTNSAAFECGKDEIGRRYAEPSALLVKVREKALALLRKLLRETGGYPIRHHSSPIPGCPRCGGSMTFEGVQSIGAGAARVYNVEVYLCPKCGCKGRYDEKPMKIIEIK